MRLIDAPFDVLPNRKTVERLREFLVELDNLPPSPEVQTAITGARLQLDRAERRVEKA
jgi:hypothetical protein